MGSLLTNDSAMVALTTLRQINRDLSSVQQEISTGKSVSNARDNAAIWAVSTVMQSDVNGFEAISSSLDLGAATVGVARGAAERITEQLQDMKDLIVAAQEDNVDRDKIQTDVDEIERQITTIVDAAQFNGLNLLKGTEAVNILASLNRTADGAVSTSNIQIARNDLSITGGEALDVNSTITASVQLADGSSAQTSGDIVIGGTITAGEVFTVDVEGTAFAYTAQQGDDAAAVGDALRTAIQAGTLPTDVAVAGTGATLSFTNDSAATIDITGAITAANSSGLAAVADIDVTTSEGATAALSSIEGLIQVGINAAAAFGSSQKRIDNQNEFVQTLMDSLKVGIGALTDADMEEASARLQSLQVQQQLGVQALAIANQRPQVLLGLFQ